MKQHYTQGRELAAKGRHGDSMLLHVSPKEVHGLASLGALTGRRVTINPDTGLPEAFDFSTLLPVAAAIATSFIPGGAVFAPLVAGAVSGIRTAAKGGSLGDVAQSAAISGATTYAGGQLASGIGELGTLGGSGAAPGALPTVAGVDAAAKASDATAKTAANAAIVNAKYLPQGDPFSVVQTNTPGYTPPVGPQAPTFAENLSAFGTKAENIGRAFTDNTGETLKYMASKPLLTAGTALGLSGMGQYQALADNTDDEKRTYPLREGFGKRSPPQTTSFPGAGYNPDAGDYNYFPGAGQPSTPPATPTAGNYFASGGGSVPSGLRAMPDQRMASGGAPDSSADMFRRPFGEAFNMPTDAYSPTYLTFAPKAQEAPEAPAPVGRGFVLRDDRGGDGGEGGPPGGNDNDTAAAGQAAADQAAADQAGGMGGAAGVAAAGGLITLRKAAGGRAAGNPDHYGMTAGLMAEAQAALLGQHDDPRRALARFEAMFGAGALQMLRDKIGGGRIRGAGGGLDDLIPGTIEGKQRVRLADGEFVVPADVVSGIGDGSTDQGVRKLHEMMTTVRAERTGKRTQPKRLREGALIV